MESATKPSTLQSIFQQRCPHCRLGRIFRYSIFRGFPKMCERCSICDLKFEREPGYFLGAMYISYVLGVSIMAPIAALLWFLTGWWITKVIIWAAVLFLPLAPTITLFARVLWILTRASIPNGHASESHTVTRRKGIVKTESGKLVSGESDSMARLCRRISLARRLYT